jgi:hypothetical protein
MQQTTNVYNNMHTNLLVSFIKLFTCTIAITLSSALVFAQRDTTKKQTIQITSSYKPVLRNSVKINLSASPLAADTSRPRLAYNIPAQNLFFSYQPISLKPLALVQDPALALGLRNYIKVGFGNFSTPYVNAGFSFGDGKTALMNIYADYISSKGKIANQDFAEFKARGLGSYFVKGNEIYGGAGVSNRTYHQYGYNHAIHTFDKKSIRNAFQDISISAGVRNVAVNEARFSYDPNAEIHMFSRANATSESSLMLTVPFEKKFGESFTFKASAKADLTSFTNKAISSQFNKIKNNLYSVSPSLVINTDRFTLNGGINPSWNNGEFVMLPNIYGEAQLQHNVLIVQAGWTGRFIKNSHRTLSLQNPYIDDPFALLNTKEMQYFGGVKATLGKHFNFNAKAAYITYNNMPLFINDGVDGKSFRISFEERLHNFQIHADASVISQDKFTITAAVDLNNYGGTRTNAEPWHMIPVELTGSFRWNAFKQVLLKGDLHTFTGSKALLQGGAVRDLKGGTDLSAGAEFRVNKNFRAWVDLYNILNSKYERWNNYPVYGFQVLGGLIYNF